MVFLKAMKMIFANVSEYDFDKFWKIIDIIIGKLPLINVILKSNIDFEVTILKNIEELNYYWKRCCDTPILLSDRNYSISPLPFTYVKAKGDINE